MAWNLPASLKYPPASAFPVLGLQAHAPTWHFVLTWVLVPLTTLASMFLSDLSFLLPQKIFFHFHRRAVTRPQTPPPSAGVRTETEVFCLQLPSPCLLQLTYKSYPKHLVQKAWRSEASEASLSQVSLSGMETRFGLLGEQSLFYENW